MVQVQRLYMITPSRKKARREGAKICQVAKGDDKQRAEIASGYLSGRQNQRNQVVDLAVEVCDSLM